MMTMPGRSKLFYAFESAIIWVATSGIMIQAIANMGIKKMKLAALFNLFGLKIAPVTCQRVMHVILASTV